MTEDITIDEIKYRRMVSIRPLKASPTEDIIDELCKRGEVDVYDAQSYYFAIYTKDGHHEMNIRDPATILVVKK
jgi:hypothetical protein